MSSKNEKKSYLSNSKHSKFGPVVITDKFSSANGEITEATFNHITNSTSSSFDIRIGLFAPVLRKTVGSKICDDFEKNGKKRELIFPNGKLVVKRVLLTQMHHQILEAIMTIRNNMHRKSDHGDNKHILYAEFKAADVSKIYGSRLNTATLKEKLEDLKVAPIEMIYTKGSSDTESSNRNFAILSEYAYDEDTKLFSVEFNNTYIKLFGSTIGINYGHLLDGINKIKNGFVQHVIKFFLTHDDERSIFECAYKLETLLIDTFKIVKKEELDEQLFRHYIKQLNKKKSDLFEYGIDWDVDTKKLTYTSKKNVFFVYPGEDKQKKVATKKKEHYDMPKIEGEKKKNMPSQTSIDFDTQTSSKVDIPEYLNLKSSSELTDDMKQIARELMDEVDISVEFEKFKNYYLQKGYVVENYVTQWTRWLEKYYEIYGASFRFPINAELEKEFIEVALKHKVEKSSIAATFLMFKNFNLSKGKKSQSWISDWENWCIQSKERLKRNDALGVKAKEKLDLQTLITVSDQIKLELEKQNFDWNSSILRGESIHDNIGCKEIKTGARKTETILYYKSSEDGIVLEQSSEDVIDVEVL